MPISFTPLGNILDVSIIDGNFEDLQNLFRTQILKADIAERFTRFRVSRYTTGRIVAQHIFENPFRHNEHGGTKQVIDRLDIPYRKGTEDSWVESEVEDREEDVRAHAMELLGRPGSSFWFDFQEEGIAESILTGAGVVDWPPDKWPYSRYPDHLCYSRWLTIPGASTRVYVPHRCTVRVRGSSAGSTSFWQDGPTVQPREAAHVRVGLIVDTNPILYADEFQNGNTWIKGPDGNTSPTRTWKVIEDWTMTTAQRETIQISGEVNLKGGRWYNFRFAYRSPGYFGWVNEDTNTFVPEVWERSWVIDPSTGLYTSPSNSPTVHQPRAYLGAIGGDQGKGWFKPNFVNLWESSAVELEFYYGRATADVDTTDHSDFESFAE